MGNEFVVLRDDNPQRDDLESLGYTIVGQSWGARLQLSDPPNLSIFRQALSRVQAEGISIAELAETSSADLNELEKANSAAKTPPLTVRIRDNQKATMVRSEIVT